MKTVVQRVVIWCLSLACVASSSLGWSADRPPASDEPWPAAEPAQFIPDPAARPIVTRTTAPAKTRTPANPVVAANRAPSSTTKAKSYAGDDRAYRAAQPVGSGVRPAAYVEPAPTRPTAARQPSKVRRTSGFVPLHEHTRQVAGINPSADEVFEEHAGEMVIEEADGGAPYYVPATEEEMFFEDDCDACGGCGNCVDCCLLPCPPWGSLQAWAGTCGFTGPLNMGGAASFGFQEGLNYGAPLPFGMLPDIGWQVGARFTQTSLSGSDLTTASRQQTFLSAGLFRRVHQGLQWGIAYDLLYDTWYGKADLSQVRGEVAWVYRGHTEYGVWWTTGATQTTPTLNVPTTPAVAAALNTTWQPTDLFAFYLRRYFGTCDLGQARVFAGATGSSDGLIGADAFLPMTDNWSFQAGFTYLIPEESTGTGANAGHAQESWNLAVSLVWVPGHPQHNMFRPLMSVADNGNFMVDRQ